MVMTQHYPNSKHCLPDRPRAKTERRICSGPTYEELGELIELEHYETFMGPYEAENYDAFVGEYERMAQRRQPI